MIATGGIYFLVEAVEAPYLGESENVAHLSFNRSGFTYSISPKPASRACAWLSGTSRPRVFGRSLPTPNYPPTRLGKMKPSLSYQQFHVYPFSNRTPSSTLLENKCNPPNPTKITLFSKVASAIRSPLPPTGYKVKTPDQNSHQPNLESLTKSFLIFLNRLLSKIDDMTPAPQSQPPTFAKAS